MKDRDEHSFDPGAPDFVENALSYALRKSFADFNFRTLTAIKSDPKIGFVCGFDQWKKERKKQGKPATTTERTDYLMEKLENANFYRQFVEYFKPNSLHKNDFEKWHHDTCTLFLNTLQRGMSIMNAAGIKSHCDRQDTEQEILLTIHIPKARP